MTDEELASQATAARAALDLLDELALVESEDYQLVLDLLEPLETDGATECFALAVGRVRDLRAPHQDEVARTAIYCEVLELLEEVIVEDELARMSTGEAAKPPRFPIRDPDTLPGPRPDLRDWLVGAHYLRTDGEGDWDAEYGFTYEFIGTAVAGNIGSEEVGIFRRDADDHCLIADNRSFLVGERFNLPP